MTIAARQEVSLVDVLDQLLATGVVLSGDVDLSIAEVTLARVRLLALVSSVDTLRPSQSIAEPAPPRGAPSRGPGPAGPAGPSRAGTTTAPGVSTSLPELDRADRALADFADGLARDPEKVQQGLVQLVLSLVELLRQLMERQALRRFEAGSLTDEQVERVGTTLMLLQRRMDELRETFGLTEDDLSLDLGPLGRTV